MNKSPGIVPDDVLERLNQRIDMMKDAALAALTALSHAPNADEVHTRLQAAHQINHDMMQLAQLVHWQESLRKDAAEAKRQGREGVLQ